MMPSPEWMAQRWATTRAWHEQQRNLPVRAKLTILIQLQHRQQAINRSKIAMGLPPVPMRVWETRP